MGKTHIDRSDPIKVKRQPRTTPQLKVSEIPRNIHGALIREKTKGFVGSRHPPLLMSRALSRIFYHSYDDKSRPGTHAAYIEEDQKNPPHMPSLELLEGVNGLATQYMTEYPDSEPALKDAFDAQALVFLGMLVEENVKYNMTSFHDKYDQVSQSINQQVHARMTRNLNTFAQDPSSDDASDNNDDAGSSSSSSTSSSSDGIQDSSD